MSALLIASFGIGTYFPAYKLSAKYRTVDLLPDYRLSRLGAALAKPPFYRVVVIFACLFTMLRLALYPQSRAVVTIAVLYALLIGMIVFLIHAFSDPFHGATGVDPAPIEYLLEKLQER